MHDAQAAPTLVGRVVSGSQRVGDAHRDGDRQGARHPPAGAMEAEHQVAQGRAVDELQREVGEPFEEREPTHARHVRVREPREDRRLRALHVEHVFILGQVRVQELQRDGFAFVVTTDHDRRGAADLKRALHHVPVDALAFTRKSTGSRDEARVRARRVRSGARVPALVPLNFERLRRLATRPHSHPYNRLD